MYDLHNDFYRFQTDFEEKVLPVCHSSVQFVCVSFIFFIEQKSLILMEVDLSFLITYLVLLASCLRNSFQIQYH